MKKNLKGIILAGGHGSRLFPSHMELQSSYCLFMINLWYIILSILMGAGIRDILIISTPKDTPDLRTYLVREKTRIQIDYIVQKEPRGIAESFILATDFIKW